MLSEMSEDLRKILLAGLGAAAVTSEKTRQIVNELVKKGEITLDQGKVLNEELQHKIREKGKECGSDGDKASKGVDGVMKAVEKMSPEELDALKKKMAELESARKTPASGAGDNAGK